MGFGKPMDTGQSLGRKNLAESLKLARLRGVGFPVRQDRHRSGAAINPAVLQETKKLTQQRGTVQWLDMARRRSRARLYVKCRFDYISF